MTGGTARRFDRAFKLAALARMAAGKNVSALSCEFGVRRKLLYRWRDTVRRGGAEAGGVGRPRSGEKAVIPVARLRMLVPAGVAVPDELAEDRPVGAGAGFSGRPCSSWTRRVGGEARRATRRRPQPHPGPPRPSGRVPCRDWIDDAAADGGEFHENTQAGGGSTR